MRKNVPGSLRGFAGRLVLGAGLAGFLTPSARAAVDPVKLFNAHVINGVGGYYDFTASSYSVLCNVVGAAAIGAYNLVLVSDGQMGDLSYAGLPASSYLHLPGGDADDRAGYDVSPNVWAGSDKGTSALFSFSALGNLNPRGYPSAHQTYVGSDIAIMGALFSFYGTSKIRLATPGGAPAFVYGAQSVKVGHLNWMTVPWGESNFVVFSKSAPAASNLGDGSVVNYLLDFNTGLVTAVSVVSTRTSLHRTKNPIGNLADMNSDIAIDILVGDRQDSPPLKWFKNPGNGNITDANYQPVNVADADVFHPAAVFADRFDNDSFTDILVARDGAGADRRLTLLHGTDATGTNFTVKHITGFPWAASALAVTDLDGDGRPDVVSGMFPDSDPQPSPVTIFFSDAGFNTWTPQPLPRGGLFTGTLLDVKVGDVNGDTKPDVVALFSGEGPDDAGYRSRRLSSNVHVWINRNTGGSRNQWFDFGLAEPALPAAASGSSGGSLVLRPGGSIVRVAQKCPVVLFENRYKSQQEFRIQATTGRGRNRHTSTVITDGNGNVRRQTEGNR